MTAEDRVVAAVVEAVRAAAPELKQAGAWRGPVDATAIGRIATQSPAALVSLLSIGDPELPGEGSTDVAMGLSAWIVTTGKDRGPAAAAIVRALVLMLARWRVPGMLSGPAERVEARNMYSGKLETKGLTLWVVLWRQKVRITAGDPDLGGVCPERLYLDDGDPELIEEIAA